MKLFAAVLILLPQFASGQDAESLRARIEAHYTAIHASDRDVTRSHHLPEISIFPGDGPLGTFRVSAVWVWRDGEWLEAHHHESALSG